MASISDKILAIRNAILGKEVRSSIADGIEAINNQVDQYTQNENNRISAENERVTNENERVTEFNTFKTEAETATNNANTAASAATTATTNATNAASAANTAATSANSAVNNINNNTLIIWKPYVNTYADIATTYPNPSIGWATQTVDTHTRYRWNSSSWVNIGVYSDDKTGDMSQISETNLVQAILNDRLQLSDKQTQITYNNNKLEGIQINALYPPTGQIAVHADNIVDDSMIIQNLLNYISTNFGSGSLMLPPNKILKCSNGITIPQGVTLIGNGSLLDFSSAGNIVAITINGSGFTPLSNINIKGNNTGNASNFSTTTSTGLSVIGNKLNFHKVSIYYFNYGIDLAHSNTYLITLDYCNIYLCAIDIYADLYSRSATTAGERITFNNCNFFNSQLICKASSNALDMYFNNCSCDYSNYFFSVNDAMLFFNNCHFESNSSGTSGSWYSSVNYLFDTGSSGGRLLFTNCLFDIFNMSLVINSTNFNANAKVCFTNCIGYYKNSLGTTTNCYSDENIFAYAGATSATMYSCFISQITYPFAISSCNWNNMQNNVTAYISAVDVVNGKITISFSSTLPHNGYTRVSFG
ncbi:MAG: hypothetical protein Q8936_01655 [Bacillota bacterium]|nr:hypothetical protein [Bacillota bacterium]